MHLFDLLHCSHVNWVQIVDVRYNSGYEVRHHTKEGEYLYFFVRNARNYVQNEKTNDVKLHVIGEVPGWKTKDKRQ